MKTVTRRRTSVFAVAMMLLAGLAVVGAPAALAHHPEIAVTTSCDPATGGPVLSVTANSWSFVPTEAGNHDDVRIQMRRLKADGTWTGWLHQIGNGVFVPGNRSFVRNFDANSVMADFGTLGSMVGQTVQVRLHVEDTVDDEPEDLRAGWYTDDGTYPIASSGNGNPLAYSGQFVIPGGCQANTTTTTVPPTTTTTVPPTTTTTVPPTTTTTVPPTTTTTAPPTTTTTAPPATTAIQNVTITMSCDAAGSATPQATVMPAGGASVQIVAVGNGVFRWTAQANPGYAVNGLTSDVFDTTPCVKVLGEAIVATSTTSTTVAAVAADQLPFTGFALGRTALLALSTLVAGMGLLAMAARRKDEAPVVETDQWSD